MSNEPTPQDPPQLEPNLVKVAITAAGGRNKVAASFGADRWSVTHWSRTGRVPTHHIRRLCELGGNLVKVDDLLGYIERREQARAAEKAA